MTSYYGSKGGGAPGMPPSRFKFFHFHAVFGKEFPNNRLGHPLRSWCPLKKILDPPLPLFEYDSLTRLLCSGHVTVENRTFELKSAF